MLKKLISFLSLPVLLTSVSFAQTSFEALQPMSAADIQAGISASDNIPAAKKYGVSYTLTGALSIHEDKVLLNTPDGRLFELDLSVSKAKAFDGQNVQVEAKAKQADDMSVLKVESIAKYDASHEITLPDHIAKQRPAGLVSDADGSLVVNNVRWLSPGATPSKDSFDWATATIKPELIKNVYFIKKPFAPEWIAAHSLMVFNFEKGGLTDANGNEASGLTLSIEAYLREGQDYGLVDGMKKDFGIVWTLATWEDYSSRTALLETGTRLIPYPVNLSHDQEVKLVREAVKLATVNREGEYYNTITNNCTNNLVIVIDHVLPANRQIKMWKIPYLVFNLRATMPVWVPAYLQQKGLIGQEMPPVTTSNYMVPLP